MATTQDVEGEAAANKLKALQAMAAGSGDPLTAGQQAVQASGNDALAGMASDAALRGVSPQEKSDLSSMVTGPSLIAASSLGSQAPAYSAYEDALRMTGVAQPSVVRVSGGGGGGGGADGGGSSQQFKPQMYGPYFRYGGYGSEGEFEDAVTAAARQEAERQSAQYGQAAAAQEQGNAARGTGVLSAAGAMAGGVMGVPGPRVGGPVALGIGGAKGGWPGGAARNAPLQTGHPGILEGGTHSLIGVSTVPGLGIHAPRPVPAITDFVSPLELGIARGLRGSEQSAVDPVQLYRYAQQVAEQQYGAEPSYAAGHFSPEWSMGLATKDLTGPSDYRQAQNEYQQRVNNGGFTDEELRTQAAVNDAMQTAALKQSPEYQTGANFIDGAVQATAQGAKPLTLDQVKLGLAKLGIPSDVMSQLIHDYSNVFPSTSFVTNSDIQTQNPYG